MRQCSSPPVCYMSHDIYHVSHVTCHLSYVTCHMSHVTCIFFIFFRGEGGRAKIGTSSGWWISHPLGTPHLVLIRTTIVVYCNSIDSVENLKSAKYFRFSKISNFYIFEIRTFIIHTFAITPTHTHTLSVFTRLWCPRTQGWEAEAGSGYRGMWV